MSKAVFLLCILPVFLYGSSYSEAISKASKALKAKDPALALQHYSRAHKLAKGPGQKFRILPIQITLYLRLKKTVELEKFLEKERQDDRYSDPQLRYLLNWNARINIWPKRDIRYAMELLQMARNLYAEEHSNFYFETFQFIAEIYFREKKYDYVIYYLFPLLEIKKLHPSNRYKTCMAIGRAYRAKGDRKTALNYFQQALAAGKKVPYKYNYSEAQRYIKELSK